ncbi:hypothetical protein K1W54_27200 [Micromonospora sp. CPCC 205371]|nr:hypothetical protein [Micromonospora sp. CPCC 205371]
MTALVRYTVSGLVRSQRYLPPALLFVTAVVVLTTNDFGPLVGSYAGCALAQFVCLVWLTITVVNTEDPIQRSMTAVAAGSSQRVLLASVVTALGACACLTVVGTVYPIWGGRHTVTGAAVAVGVGAQLVAGLAGIAVGLVCSRLVVPRPGYALVVALGLIGVLIVIPPVPPIGPVMRLLSSERAPEAMVGPLLVQFAIAAAMLVIATVVTQSVARRRE